MDSSSNIPHSEITNHLPLSVYSDPNSNPNFSPNPSSGASSVGNHFLSAPIPKGKRRGRPRTPTPSLNQVKSLPSLPSSNLSFVGVSGVGVSSGGISNVEVSSVSFSGSKQVTEAQMGKSTSLSSRKPGSGSNSVNFDKKSVDDLSDEIIVINKEATSEALIALTSGFPADSLTDEEIDYGVVSVVGGIEQVNYILIRNHIFARWRENVSRWVTKEMFVKVVPEHCAALLDSAYRYLVAHGYINFGVAPAIKERMLVAPSKPNVIIIGAGLAGLAAARQLMAFGFKVLVLEGRKRAGGRVYTIKLEATSGPTTGFADLGGSVLTGTLGNPLGILARQLSFTLHKVRDKCPLYRMDGTPVDPDVDHEVEHAFNKLLDTVSLYRKEIGDIAQDISLGAALETYRVPCNEEELSLFNWHFANLEYANAGLLSRLSLAFWDQDDPFDMGGDHCFLPGGNGRLIEALVQNVPILYEKTVHAIRYGKDGVQVAAGGQVYEGDMVLCTVPLGVLKTGSIKFMPELPQRKLDGIRRLGFGLLNKIAMLFPHAFWGTDLDTFGHLSDDPSRRGEFFLFYSYATVAGGPILIGLVAGEAAHRFEVMEPAIAVARVLRILKDIYEPKGIEVPDPIQTVCTRWAGDTFCCGSYSHVSVGASGADYDILAESVGDGRLFFAGEATNRRYPATMHGALLSGFREAANMAYYARVRALGLKIEKSPSENAHNCASILADLFRAPDVEFGSFAVIYGRKNTDSMAVLRVTFGGQRKKQEQQYSNKLLFEQLQSHFNQQLELHVYALLSKQQANELRELRGGDESRLKYLVEKLGVKLVGRKGLGPAADSVIEAIKAERIRGRRNRKPSTSGKSISKAASVRRGLIRKAKIVGNGNRTSVQSPLNVIDVVSRSLGDSDGSTLPNSNLVAIAISSNCDGAPLGSHSGEFMADTSGSVPRSQNVGHNNFTTSFGSNAGSTSLSRDNRLALPSPNVGLVSMGDISSHYQNADLGSSGLTQASSNSEARALGIDNSLSLPSVSSSVELAGDITKDGTQNLDDSNCLFAPQSSEVGTRALSSDRSLAPSDLHISSFGSGEHAGDISDSIGSVSVQDNIFEDIMNELLPPSGTNSGSWQFTGKL